MVVSYNYGACTVGYRIGENFARMHDCSVDESDRYDASSDEFVCAVKRTANEAFLLAVRPMGYDWPYFFGGRYPPGPGAEDPTSQFESRTDRASLSLSYTD
jgi:hypothetical protein